MNDREGFIWIDDQDKIGENQMIQITKVQSVERGKREDLGMTAGNLFFMAFDNT